MCQFHIRYVSQELKPEASISKKKVEKSHLWSEETTRCLPKRSDWNWVTLILKNQLALIICCHGHSYITFKQSKLFQAYRVSNKKVLCITSCCIVNSMEILLTWYGKAIEWIFQPPGTPIVIYIATSPRNPPESLSMPSLPPQNNINIAAAFYCIPSHFYHVLLSSTTCFIYSYSRLNP